MNQIEELAKHVSSLKKLLDDPHPGLFTWQSFARDEIKWIVDFWNAK